MEVPNNMLSGIHCFNFFQYKAETTPAMLTNIANIFPIVYGCSGNSRLEFRIAITFVRGACPQIISITAVIRHESAHFGPHFFIFGEKVVSLQQYNVKIGIEAYARL